MKTIITGAGGQLGRYLCRLLGTNAVALSRADCDITNYQQVKQAVARGRADAVINTAAYTDVDRAEIEPEKCLTVNLEGVQNLVKACQESKIPLVHLSSDYVFGQEHLRESPYRETDLPGPINVYGRSKLAGEEVLKGYSKHLIIRTCGLYGHVAAQDHRNNFVETMLELSQGHQKLSVVDDQLCTPSFVLHIAQAILFLLRTEATGTFHVVNAGKTTWYDFAQEIFSLSNIEIELKRISSEDYGAQAGRPGYSVLDTSKYLAHGGPRLPSWQDALAEYLKERGKASVKVPQ